MRATLRTQSLTNTNYLIVNLDLSSMSDGSDYEIFDFTSNDSGGSSHATQKKRNVN